jgi:hypothetical protein
VDALAPGPVGGGEDPAPRRSADGVLVGVMLVVLAPAFLSWELVSGVVRAVVSLADGIALRLRTAGRALVWTLRSAVALVGRTLRRWAELRRHVVDAAAEARRRFLAARLRERLAVRRHG